MLAGILVGGSDLIVFLPELFVKLVDFIFSLPEVISNCSGRLVFRSGVLEWEMGKEMKLLPQIAQIDTD